MIVHIIGIGILAIIFVLGTTRPINLGVLSLFAGIALTAVVAGGDFEILYNAFPADLLILLVGVTFLFGIASINGTIAWLVDASARLVRGNVAVLPWAIFFVSAIPTTAGALGPATVAFLAPIGLQLAKRYDINRRLIGLMIVHGSACGNFSPINVLGAIVNQALEGAEGLSSFPLILFAANFGYNVLLGVVIYFVFGGRQLIRRQLASRGSERVLEMRAAGSTQSSGGLGVTEGPDVPKVEDAMGLAHEKLTSTKVVTLVTIALVAAITLSAGVDIGILALSAAVILKLILWKSSEGAETAIAWNVVLLVGGIVTYIGVLQYFGTVEFVGESASALDNPLLTALIICAVAAIVSAFASSTGIIIALIPIASPFLLQGEISIPAMIAALTICATVVDSTPFSTVGSLVLASAEAEKQRSVYRGMLAWGAAMVVTAPLITVLVLVLPTM